MDTRFWGPDGWKLLHSIAYNYPSQPSKNMKKKYVSFFKTLPYILPCVYCRDSLSQYYEELPIEDFLNNNNNNLFDWLYHIHNKVNLKLRNQYLNKKKNPSLLRIRKFYKNYIATINKNNCIDMPGLNFIYSIAFNYPTHKDNFKHKIRFTKHKIFLKLLDDVLPFAKFKKIYRNITKDADFNKILLRRSLFKKWFYKTDKHIKDEIDLKCSSYGDQCKYIETYRATCKKKTCRIKH